MNLSKRIEKLENERTPEQLPVLDIEIVSCRDHVDHPERYKRNLISEETSESGLVTRTFKLE